MVLDFLFELECRVGTLLVSLSVVVVRACEEFVQAGDLFLDLGCSAEVLLTQGLQRCNAFVDRSGRWRRDVDGGLGLHLRNIDGEGGFWAHSEEATVWILGTGLCKAVILDVYRAVTKFGGWYVMASSGVREVVGGVGCVGGVVFADAGGWKARRRMVAEESGDAPQRKCRVNCQSAIDIWYRCAIVEKA